MEELERKLQYHTNTHSTNQAKYDVLDLQAMQLMEEEGDENPHISIWNSNPTLMVAGLTQPTF